MVPKDLEKNLEKTGNQRKNGDHSIPKNGDHIIPKNGDHIIPKIG